MPDKLPADWDPNDPGTWYLEAGIDAFNGYHSSGAVYRKIVTIRTAAEDYGEPMCDDDGAAQWWYDVLKPIHDLACAMAECLPEEAERADARLGLSHPDERHGRSTREEFLCGDDLETDAEHARRYLDALRAAQPNPET